MKVLERITGYTDDLVAIRRDLHAHPEIGFEEERTSGVVAEKLASWGIEVHRGIGKTGVVGVLRGKGEGRRIGLRADMDALPIEEQTNLPYRSRTAGKKFRTFSRFSNFRPRRVFTRAPRRTTRRRSSRC